MMTSVLDRAGCRISWFSRVVLPLPKNPVSSETGILSLDLAGAGFGVFTGWARLLDRG